ncbi:HNHc domain-containing protein [Tenacibaculum sp. 190524A02b]|uniref:HNH endonuclease n=1 Tax=Tenacibaculum vairaonense TaxID=3137860 RepID=UPI0032B1ED05
MLDKFKRYQQEFKMKDLFPDRKDGLCACGCGTKLVGKQKRWSSEACSDRAYEIFSVLKGNTGMIRKLLYEKEQGYCRSCGVYDENWEADHILPVFLGGGATGIENFQTLCTDCHNEKSNNQMESHRKAISSQAASIDLTVLLNDLEAVE